MDVMQAIEERRSVRIFEPKPVSAEDIDRIVACALRAPSSKNAQPWRLYVVTNRELNAKIAEVVRSHPRAAISGPVNPQTGEVEGWGSTVIKSADALETAPVAIYVINASPFTGGGKSQFIGAQHIGRALAGYAFENIGIGAAVQNALLAAHALGLGAVFMGDIVIAEAPIKDLLDMTEGDLLGVIAVGYAPSDYSQWNRALEPGRVTYRR